MSDWTPPPKDAVPEEDGKTRFCDIDLPPALPEAGIGERQALDLLSGHVLGHGARLGAPTALAHMDPPTPWITWSPTSAPTAR